MPVLWSWQMSENSNSGVNYKPLPSGDWDGVMWDAQQHRCSNNIPMSGPIIDPYFYREEGPITWSIKSTVDDPEDIAFDVEIDQPGSDLVILKDQNMSRTTDFATSKPMSEHARGIYVSNVRGATANFSLTANVPDPPPIP